MIQAQIQHISSDTGGEYDNLKLETKALVSMMTRSPGGTEVVFYQASREKIQAVADTLNEWLWRE